jgi:hypothetical protein
MTPQQKARIERMTNLELWQHLLEAGGVRPAPGTGASGWLHGLEGELEKRLRRIGFLPDLPVQEEKAPA